MEDIRELAATAMPERNSQDFHAVETVPSSFLFVALYTDQLHDHPFLDQRLRRATDSSVIWIMREYYHGGPPTPQPTGLSGIG
jgi:hypothetical protein